MNTLVSELLSGMLRIDPLSSSLTSFVLITMEGSGVMTVPSSLVGGGGTPFPPPPGRTMSEVRVVEPADR